MADTETLTKTDKSMEICVVVDLSLCSMNNLYNSIEPNVIGLCLGHCQCDNTIRLEEESRQGRAAQAAGQEGLCLGTGVGRGGFPYSIIV